MTMPRLGSRPFARSKTLKEMKRLASSQKRGIVALVFGEARGKQPDKSPVKESSSRADHGRIAERALATQAPLDSRSRVIARAAVETHARRAGAGSARRRCARASPGRRKSRASSPRSESAAADTRQKDRTIVASKSALNIAKAGHDRCRSSGDPIVIRIRSWH